ncbi:MAG: type VI secretion system lipoprotein TssJ [Nitrospirae bacterium]|nr:type VI secretion system lipoprotein TssJ [Nitrospirota bacterium]
MKRNVLLLFLILLTAVFYSCASMGSSPEYGYKKDAIIFNLKSDVQLNLFQKSPHTLLLCVYQLTDPIAFNQLTDKKEGMQKALECDRFDPSVTSSTSLVILPNQERIDKLDRAGGTKYIGIIAGYYSLKKDKVTRLYQVPRGFFSGNPKKLKVKLDLGPQEISEKGKR